MSVHQADYTVTTLCRVLEISTSGYYAWCRRAPSKRQRRDESLLGKVRDFFKASNKIYGSPRIHADLRDDGERISRKRVARLMQADGLVGVSRRKAPRTTVRCERQRPAPDLVDRDFTATGPDQLWVADITYIPTWVGFLYLAVVLDAWSRRIVGWGMRSSLKTELVLEALNMALAQRAPDQVIHHSDQGSQYTSIAFGRRCKVARVRPSMGSVGDCYDNAMCESFFATLECELLDRRSFRTRAEARSSVFEFIESWYNRRRRHSGIGYRSPVDFEQASLSTCGNSCGKPVTPLWILPAAPAPQKTATTGYHV